MEWIALVVGILLSVIGIVFIWYGRSLSNNIKKINSEIEKENTQNELKKQQLESEISFYSRKKEEAEADFKKSMETYYSTLEASYEKYCDVLEAAYLQKETEFDVKTQSLEQQYEYKINNLSQAFEKLNLELEEKLKRDKLEVKYAFEEYCRIIEEEYGFAEAEYENHYRVLQESYNILQDSCMKELTKIQNTRAAAIAAQKREEEMALQSDFYSLHLTSLEIDTISLIEELKPRLPEPRVLSMLIWTTFYQKQMTQLCNDVLGTSVVCGIYKITNKKSNMCYIGQAANVADRWKQHAKCGLGIDTPAQNKLYRAMLAEGLTNFTFELLETCPRAQLNEKEKFYIELYQSYEFGYNSTSGNK